MEVAGLAMGVVSLAFDVFDNTIRSELDTFFSAKTFRATLESPPGRPKHIG